MSRVARAVSSLIPEGSQLPDAAWRRRHRGILVVLGLQALGIFCFSLGTAHSLGHSLLGGGIIAATAIAAALPLRPRTLQAALAAFGLVASSAILVHLSGGYIEFHFHFFVMVGLLALYQEWAPFLFAIGFVLLHHGVGGVLAPAAVYNHPAAIAHPWRWAAIHAAFIAAMSVVSLIAWRVNETTHAFSQLLLTSAGEGVVGLDLEELTTREARLEALLIVNRELSCIQPVESLLARIAEACGRLFEAHSAAFRVVEGDELVLSATWGTTDESLASGRLRVTESLAGIVATTGEPLIVTDPAADPRVSPARRESLRQLGVRSFLGVPVKLADSVIGVLTVRSVQEDGFSAADLEMAKAFASQAVVALENSRLYQETQGALQELSRTKDQLVQSQKMEAIGQLAGGIAHDFNNLLTVITGRSRLVLARVRAGDPIRRDVELIDQAAERAAALTGQLLAFSRKQVLRPKPLDLNALVGDLAPILRRLIGEHIQLVITPGGELGHVMADPGQLEQVVINLVVNARDAMPHGGTVTIGTQNRPAQHADAHLHGQVPPGHYVALMVQDSGWGMDQGTLDKIFEPFFTTKPPGKGTGLGLSTVYGIVRQSGGDIGVDSTVGRGTTFTIYLPRIDEPADPHEGQAIPAPLAQGEATILLVEDDTEVRELASELLKSCGYTVLETGDPLEALVIGERHRGEISLLISDIVMPAMWGPALAAQLRRHHDLCVLYMSGYTDEMLAAQGTVEPVAPLLRKPFSLEALARAVRDTLVAKSATPLMALANQIRPG